MSLARSLRSLAAAEAFQWLPRSVVERVQLRRLRAMLEFCEREVPFYRESFRRAGVRARDLVALADLARFPLLSREAWVDADRDAVRSRPARPSDHVFRTSGTSGLFMEIAYSADAKATLDAIYLRALMTTGFRPWHRMAYFWWGAEEAPRATHERMGFMRKDFLPMAPDPDALIEQLIALRPRWIYNFPSTMVALARRVEARGITSIRPEGIVCHAELLLEGDRRRIERAFGCSVWNQYGAQEFNRIAWDCAEHGPLHLAADSVYVEVVDADGRPVAPHEEGELVVTGLVNRLEPLVRYRLGDLGRLVPEPCPCGRGLPRIELTDGRSDDVVTLPDGRTVGPRVIAPRIEDVPGLRQYRLVQTSLDRVELRVVVDEPPAELDASLRGVLRELLGDVRVDIRRTDRIELSQRGKLRKIVSEVSGGRAPDDGVAR